MSHLLPPPATDLLLGCLQFDDPAARLARLRAYSTQDWVSVLEEAQRHGVLPLLAGRMLRMEPDLVLAKQVQQRLQTVRLQAASLNLRLYHKLGQILQRMHAAAIPVIVLKGAHLAELVYEDIAMRPMGDVDLMVQKKDLERSYALIEEMGYQAQRRFRLERMVKEHHHLPPLLSNNGPVVEVHWNIAYPGHTLKVDLDGLWQRAQEAQIEGAPARVLSAEDLLVHLCLHLFQDHLAAGLKRLYDIGQTVEAYPSIDWDRIMAITHQWGGEHGGYMALRLAVDLLGAHVPPAVLSRFRLDEREPVIRAAARRHILAPEAATIHPDIMRLRSAQPLKMRVDAFRKILFPYPEYIAIRYNLPPESLWVYPYYLVRIRDMIHQYIGQLCQVLHSDPASTNPAEDERVLYEWWVNNGN